MLENSDEKTFIGLAACEWHCVGFGISDALDKNAINPESFEKNLATYTEQDKATHRSRYHYYRWSGCLVAYVRSHWLGICSSLGGLVGFFYLNKIGN